jgi:hypothetical protein
MSDTGPYPPMPDFAINYAMVARLSGSAPEADLRRAIDRLWTRHPLLLPGGEQQRIPLQVLDGGPDDWRAAATEELRNGDWDHVHGPFLRFTLLRRAGGADLIGAFHHGQCDGMSGMYVLRDVIRMWGDPALELPPVPAPLEIMKLIPRGVTENPWVKIKLEITVAALRVAGFARRLFPPKPRIARAWTGEGQPPSARLILLPYTFSAERTSALAERCRAEGTTVYAAVAAAWLRANAARMADRKTWKRRVSCPVSLRGRFPQPVPDVAGQYMAVVDIDVDCAPRRPFWEVARSLKKDLLRATSDGNVFMMPLGFHAIDTRCSPREGQSIAEVVFLGPPRYDFSITNIGRLDFPVKAGALRVEAFHNLVNSSEYEKTVNMNSFDGRLNFALLLRESLMTPDEAWELLEAAVGLLDEAVK